MSDIWISLRETDMIKRDKLKYRSNKAKTNILAHIHMYTCTHTHTHNNTRTYLYLYLCVCVRDQNVWSVGVYWDLFKYFQDISVRYGGFHSCVIEVTTGKYTYQTELIIFRGILYLVNWTLPPTWNWKFDLPPCHARLQFPWEQC